MHNVGKPLIQARELTKVYQLGGTEVVGINGIELSVFRGELVALKGNSGSGKSTLLGLLAGLDRATRGELIVADRDLQQATPRELTQYRRETVGVVFQTFNLLPTLTVLENVSLPALLAGRGFSTATAKACELLAWLDLTSRLHHLPSQLSGGEMQRTAIARALINDPAIILADEPTGNLDSHNGRMVMELLGTANCDLGATIIIATHSDLADAMATTTICLKDGAVIECIAAA